MNSSAHLELLSWLINSVNASPNKPRANDSVAYDAALKEYLIPSYGRTCVVVNRARRTTSRSNLNMHKKNESEIESCVTDVFYRPKDVFKTGILENINNIGQDFREKSETRA